MIAFFVMGLLSKYNRHLQQFTADNQLRSGPVINRSAPTGPGKQQLVAFSGREFRICGTWRPDIQIDSTKNNTPLNFGYLD